MKNYLMGFLLAYTILGTAFAVGMANGQIASINQACVERASIVPADFATQIEKKSK